MKSSIKRIGLIFVASCALCWAGSAPAAMAVEQGVVLVAQAGDDLHQRLPNDGDLSRQLTAGGVILKSPGLVSRFYSQRYYRLAWLNAFGPLPAVDELVSALAEVESEGLKTADYHLDEIHRALQALRHHDPISARQTADLDLLLTDAFLTYGSHLSAGRIDPREVHHDWSVHSRSRDVVAILEDALARDGITAALKSLSPSAPAYYRLQQALARYRALEQAGGWPWLSPGPRLELGVRDPRVKVLRERLRISGDLEDSGNQRPERYRRFVDASTAGGFRKVAAVAETGPRSDGDTLFDETLAEAVRRFQRRHGLLIDGIVGPNTLAALNVPVSERVRQIEVNLERWRWLPEDLGERYILVNIPGFQLDVVEKGEPVLEAKVVVGKPKRPTPVFSSNVSYLVLNPYWNIPWTIAVEDMLPKLRRDPYALYRQKIRIFDTRAGGREIDPGTVNWRSVNKNNFHYRLRQDPGPWNALGRIKFMFPNEHAVYLHDTSSPGLFNTTQRTYSSGCVRVSKPVDLAAYLLKEDPRWTQNTIQSATTRRRERTVNLPEEIPIHLLYWTAWVDESGVDHFRDDIYDYDKSVSQALYAS